MSPADEPEVPHVGTVLADRYELVRHIARGGMGDVYEAVDRLLERRVAVKVYRAASPADRARFDSEVHCLASLNHPGLVRVFDAGPCGLDDAFVVLELIDGPPLSASMGEGRALPPRQVAGLGAAIADALAYIHGHGVVHRDVTPANVLCGPDGRPRLVDFGIVRLLDTPRVTAASIAVGTARYMAPEQVQGLDVTTAADIYSLGLVLLEALTGRHEFVGSMQEVAMARLTCDPDTITGTPPEWQPLLARMVSRDPAARPTAAEVRRQLDVLAGGEEDATLPALEVAGDDTPAEALTQPIDLAGTAMFPAAMVPAAIVADRVVTPTPRRSGRLWALGVGIAACLMLVLVVAANARSNAPTAPTTPTTVASASSAQPVATTAPIAVRKVTASTTTTTTSTTSTLAPTTTVLVPPTVPPATLPSTPTTSAPPTTTP